MTAEEFYDTWRCYLDTHEKRIEFAEAYAKQENEAKDKQIAELKEQREAHRLRANIFENLIIDWANAGLPFVFRQEFKQALKE